MDKDKLKSLIENSVTYTEVLKKLNLRAAGGNFNTLKKYISKYNIDINHFKTDEVRINKLKNHTELFLKKELKEYLIENSNYGRGHLKNRLYSEGLKERKCEICGQDEYWFGKKMSLILDHINGVWNDNRIENLRIVCPNCNSTLDTHCRKPPINDTREMVKIRINQRKVERPEYEVLINQVEQLGYSAVGRIYGVSDNSIRKWIKFYEKNR